MNLISIKDFSKRTKVSTQYIYELLNNDKLPSLKVAGLRVIDLDNTDIVDYLQNHS